MRMKKIVFWKEKSLKVKGLFDVINQCVYYPLEKCDWITDLLSLFFFLLFSPLLKKDYWVFAWRKRGLGDNHSTWTERKIGWLWFWSQGSKFLWWNDVINRQNFFFSFLSWEKANLSPLSHRPRPNPKPFEKVNGKKK